MKARDSVLSRSFYPASALSESYKSHNSPRAWMCHCRRRPGPATHDVGDERPSDWRRLFDRRGGLSRSPDQPQRSLAPCGNQRGTPTKSRKQTIRRERSRAAAKFPLYIRIDSPILLKRTFANRTGWTRKWSTKRLKLSVHKSWLV